MKARILGFFCSLLIVNFAIGQTIDGKLYTQFNNYYKWRGGAFDSTLLLPIDSAATGLRAGAIRYRSADSSVYTWSGTQWRKVSAATPTLQQVTTAGNSTTDSLNIKTPLNKLAVSITSVDFAGAENTSGEIKLRNTFDNSYLFMNEGGITRYTSGTALAKQLTFSSIRNQYSQISIPDSSGTLAQRVSINGNTYEASQNGVIDLNSLWINGSATLDFPNTSNNTESDLTITVTGASEGDVVSLGVPNASIHPHSCYTAWVSSANTVTVRFNNYGSGNHNPASGTFKIKVFK